MSSSEGQGSVKDPLIGQVVQGRYQVVRPIGKGAMGVVYEAQHLLIGRKVALKTMAAHASMSPACVKRFRREAKAAASVGNSHIVDVLDMGQLGSGSFYMVLEHLDGVELGFAVAAARRFSVTRALHVLCQLCDALSAVHAAGIVHRDLKPENVFLIDCDGAPDFVKVLDFGVCKLSGADAGRLTASGDTVGTPLFMAPEQAEGRSDIDHRTDIYALGAILYFLLTGQAPFISQSLPQLFVKICNEPPPSLSSVVPNLPMELQRVVNRAMSKDPKRRFDSCSALKAELLPLLTRPDAGVADRAGFLARASSLRPSRSFGVGTLGLTAVLILAAGATYVSRAPSVELAEGPPVASPTPPVPVKEPEIVRAPEPEAKASVGPEQRGGLQPPRAAPAAPTKRAGPEPLPQARPAFEAPADISNPTTAPEPPADVAPETDPPAPQEPRVGFPLNREPRDDL